MDRKCGIIQIAAALAEPISISAIGVTISLIILACGYVLRDCQRYYLKSQDLELKRKDTKYQYVMKSRMSKELEGTNTT